MSSVQQNIGEEISVERARILVVDDEPVILDILRDVLEYEGFDVATVADGDLALERIRASSFDVVLTDLKMPRVDGLELIRRLGVDGGAESFKTVIMTGFGTVSTAVEAMKNGAFDYILKPFKPADVVRLIRRALSELALQRDNAELRDTIGVYKLSQALSSTMALDQQLRLIANMVRSNLGVDGVAVYSRVGPDHPDATFCAGSPLNLETERVEVALTETGRVIARGEQVRDWIGDQGPVPCGLIAAPFRVRGHSVGFIAAITHETEKRFTDGHWKGLSIFGSRAASAIEQDRIYRDLQDSVAATIESLARALEAKDPYTAGHSDRVALYGRLLAEAYGMTPREVEHTYRGGLLHDIGKIGIDVTVLNKPQRLTIDEYEMFKCHTVLGRRIVEPIKFLRPLIPYIDAHHEAWNGKGYPRGLAGEAIPVEGRLLAVADSYDAMTSNRPYRKALPHDIALAELRRCSGKQFDRAMVELFVDAIADHRRNAIARDESVPD